METKKPRILLFDIETFANLGWVWGKYEQNVIRFKDHWFIISFAYKWVDENKIYSYSLPSFSLYKKEPKNDRELCRKLWELFNEADIVVAHNGRAFDVKKSMARFIQHEFKPPAPFKVVDTKLVAKRYFKFDSNRLDDLGQYLGLGEKIKHEGFTMWLDCVERKNMKAWKKMTLYNRQDIILLSKIYLKMRPWTDNHPNSNTIMGTTSNCPVCSSEKTQRRGFAVNRVTRFQKFQCQDCGSWFKKPLSGVAR